MKRFVLIYLLFLCFSFSETKAQISLGDDSSFSGQVYTDYYWMAQHHNEDIEGKNGFWFRRIYATYERRLSNGFSTRVRLEMSSVGDFQTDRAMTASVKDAYLKWQNNNHAIFAGISSTPTWSLVEDIWGYRPVEKSPQDLYGFGSSRDFGLAFKGALGKSGNLKYHFFVGNGNSNKPEIDKGKKVMLSLGYQLSEKIVVQGYGDYNSRTNDPDHYTAQVFGGYESEQFNAGLLYSSQHREAEVGVPAQDLDLVSVFTNFTINEDVRGYIRADHLFDGHPSGSNNSYVPFAEDVESTFLVAGADFSLSEQVHLMPNVETIIYGENSQGISPDTDLIPRLTLFWQF